MKKPIKVASQAAAVAFARLFLYIHINSYLYPLCVNKKKRSAVFNNAVMICMHKIYRVRWAARCCSCVWEDIPISFFLLLLLFFLFFRFG